MDVRPLLQVTTVLLALGAFAYYGLADRDADNQVSTNNSGPDYIVDGVHAMQTDENGLVIRHFAGTRLTHTPTPERFLLNAPDITLYSGGKPLWRMTAETATSTDLSHNIWLESNVVAIRDVRVGPALRFSTDRLHADPHAHQLDTPARVTIESPQGRVQGTGMKADLSANTLQLLSAVEVHYAPSK